MEEYGFSRVFGKTYLDSEAVSGVEIALHSFRFLQESYSDTGGNYLFEDLQKGDYSVYVFYIRNDSVFETFEQIQINSQNDELHVDLFLEFSRMMP